MAPFRADLKVSATTAGTSPGLDGNPAKPFTREQVEGLVRDGLGDDSGAKLIEQRGIDFAPAEDFLQSLKAAGASEAFLKALRAAERVDMPWLLSPSAGEEEAMKKVLAAKSLPLALLSLSHLGAGQNRSSTLDAELFKAARTGDTAAVYNLLQEGANIQAKDYEGSTPLHMAANAGIVKLLLDKGANIEAKDNYGRTPLLSVAESGHSDSDKAEMMELLLGRGANAKVKDKSPYPLLYRAPDIEVLKLLLEKGADIESRDAGGWTLLLTAAKGGNTEMVKLLLDKGANIEAKDYTLESRGPQRRVVADAISLGGYTALIWAATMGDSDMVNLLLDKGANIEARENAGRTALLQAVLSKKAWIVKLLLDRGANIETKDNAGGTPLLQAASADDTEIAKLLLEHGANTEAKEYALEGRRAPLYAAGVGDVRRDGYTPLIHAATWGNTDMVNLLLDKGANIEAKDSYGRTALVSAALLNKASVVKLLLDRGANIEAKDKDGKTALDLATSHRHTEVVWLLREKGAK